MLSLDIQLTSNRFCLAGEQGLENAVTLHGGQYFGKQVSRNDLTVGARLFGTTLRGIGLLEIDDGRIGCEDTPMLGPQERTPACFAREVSFCHGAGEDACAPGMVAALKSRGATKGMAYFLDNALKNSG